MTLNSLPGMGLEPLPGGNGAVASIPQFSTTFAKVWRPFRERPNKCGENAPKWA